MSWISTLGTDSRLEQILQPELHHSRGSRVLNSSKLRAIDIPTRIQEVCVIQDIRSFRPDFYSLRFFHLEGARQPRIDRPVRGPEHGAGSEIPKRTQNRYPKGRRVQPQTLEPR